MKKNNKQKNNKLENVAPPVKEPTFQDKLSNLQQKEIECIQTGLGLLSAKQKQQYQWVSEFVFNSKISDDWIKMVDEQDQTYYMNIEDQSKTYEHPQLRFYLDILNQLYVKKNLYETEDMTKDIVPVYNLTNFVQINPNRNSADNLHQMSVFQLNDKDDKFLTLSILMKNGVEQIENQDENYLEKIEDVLTICLSFYQSLLGLYLPQIPHTYLESDEYLAVTPFQVIRALQILGVSSREIYLFWIGKLYHLIPLPPLWQRLYDQKSNYQYFYYKPDDYEIFIHPAFFYLKQQIQFLRSHRDSIVQPNESFYRQFRFMKFQDLIMREYEVDIRDLLFENEEIFEVKNERFLSCERMQLADSIRISEEKRVQEQALMKYQKGLMSFVLKDQKMKEKIQRRTQNPNSIILTNSITVNSSMQPVNESGVTNQNINDTASAIESNKNQLNPDNLQSIPQVDSPFTKKKDSIPSALRRQRSSQSDEMSLFGRKQSNQSSKSSEDQQLEDKKQNQALIRQIIEDEEDGNFRYEKGDSPKGFIAKQIDENELRQRQRLPRTSVIEDFDYKFEDKAYIEDIVVMQIFGQLFLSAKDAYLIGDVEEFIRTKRKNDIWDYLLFENAEVIWFNKLTKKKSNFYPHLQQIKSYIDDIQFQQKVDETNLSNFKKPLQEKQLELTPARIAIRQEGLNFINYLIQKEIRKLQLKKNPMQQQTDSHDMEIDISQVIVLKLNPKINFYIYSPSHKKYIFNNIQEQLGIDQNELTENQFMELLYFCPFDLEKQIDINIARKKLNQPTTKGKIVPDKIQQKQEDVIEKVLSEVIKDAQPAQIQALERRQVEEKKEQVMSLFGNKNSSSSPILLSSIMATLKNETSKPLTQQEQFKRRIKQILEQEKHKINLVINQLKSFAEMEKSSSTDSSPEKTDKNSKEDIQFSTGDLKQSVSLKDGSGLEQKKTDVVVENPQNSFFDDKLQPKFSIQKGFQKQFITIKNKIHKKNLGDSFDLKFDENQLLSNQTTEIVKQYLKYQLHQTKQSRSKAEEIKESLRAINEQSSQLQTEEDQFLTEKEGDEKRQVKSRTIKQRSDSIDSQMSQISSRSSVRTPLKHLSSLTRQSVSPNLVDGKEFQGLRKSIDPLKRNSSTGKFVQRRPSSLQVPAIERKSVSSREALNSRDQKRKQLVEGKAENFAQLEEIPEKQIPSREKPPSNEERRQRKKQEKFKELTQNDDNLKKEVQDELYLGENESNCKSRPTTSANEWYQDVKGNFIEVETENESKELQSQTKQDEVAPQPEKEETQVEKQVGLIEGLNNLINDLKTYVEQKEQDRIINKEVSQIKQPNSQPINLDKGPKREIKQQLKTSISQYTKSEFSVSIPVYHSQDEYLGNQDQNEERSESEFEKVGNSVYARSSAISDFRLSEDSQSSDKVQSHLNRSRESKAQQNSEGNQSIDISKDGVLSKSTLKLINSLNTGEKLQSDDTMEHLVKKYKEEQEIKISKIKEREELQNQLVKNFEIIQLEKLQNTIQNDQNFQHIQFASSSDLSSFRNLFSHLREERDRRTASTHRREYSTQIEVTKTIQQVQKNQDELHQILQKETSLIDLRNQNWAHLPNLSKYVIEHPQTLAKPVKEFQTPIKTNRIGEAPHRIRSLTSGSGLSSMKHFGEGQDEKMTLDSYVNSISEFLISKIQISDTIRADMKSEIFQKERMNLLLQFKTRIYRNQQIFGQVREMMFHLPTFNQNCITQYSALFSDLKKLFLDCIAILQSEDKSEFKFLSPDSFKTFEVQHDDIIIHCYKGKNFSRSTTVRPLTIQKSRLPTGFDGETNEPEI